MSTSAQRELVELSKGLHFIGVPALAAPKKVRAAIEQAWFEQRVASLRYRSSSGEVSEHKVRIVSVLMERTRTILEGEATETGTKRHFRLDRIENVRLE